LGDYITDGQEGLVCRDHDKEAVAQQLERALTMSRARRQAMRHAAREQAERSFDYRNYVTDLAEFLRQMG
jgi:glycosyltransferase involved in cell wall biosynthesis